MRTATPVSVVTVSASFRSTVSVSPWKSFFPEPTITGWTISRYSSMRPVPRQLVDEVAAAVDEQIATVLLLQPGDRLRGATFEDRGVPFRLGQRPRRDELRHDVHLLAEVARRFLHGATRRRIPRRSPDRGRARRSSTGTPPAGPRAGRSRTGLVHAGSSTTPSSETYIASFRAHRGPPGASAQLLHASGGIAGERSSRSSRRAPRMPTAGRSSRSTACMPFVGRWTIRASTSLRI